MTSSSNVYNDTLTSNPGKQDSINDSVLSDAIADILNSSTDDKKTANKLTNKSVTPDLSDDSGTPPMPEVYLSSESLDLGAPLASRSNSCGDRFRYEADFEEFDDSASTATDYDIPSICSSPSASTHDLSLLSDDDILELGHVDYLEDVAYDSVATSAQKDTPAESDLTSPTDAPVASGDIDNQHSLQNPTSFQFETVEPNSTSQMSSIAEEIISAISKTGSSVASDVIQAQQIMTDILPQVVTGLEGTEDTIVPVLEMIGEGDHYSDETPVTIDISIDDEDLLGNADYLEEVEIFRRDKSPIAVLPNDTDRVDAPQESPSNDGDTDNKKLTPTANSLHVVKEESTPISEISSITEEIASAVSDDELSAAVENDVILPEDVISPKSVQIEEKDNYSVNDDCSSPVTVDISIDDEDLLGNADYLEEVEIFRRDKSSIAVLPNDTDRVDAPQESPSNDGDIDIKKLTPTGSSLHVVKEESTPISETSSIVEEIVSTVGDDEPSRCDIFEEDHYSVSKEMLDEDLADDLAISINDGYTSEGTSDDASSFMSSSETFVTEDVSIVEDDLLGNADYVEDVEFFDRDKSSLITDTVQVDGPQESPPNDDDTDNKKLTQTASSFHIARDESTSVSEASSIAEEIASAVSDDESSIADVMEIQQDAVLPEEVCRGQEEPTTSIGIVKKSSSMCLSISSLTFIPNTMDEIEPDTTNLNSNTIQPDNDTILQEEVDAVETNLSPSSLNECSTPCLIEDTSPFSSQSSSVDESIDLQNDLTTYKSKVIAAAITSVVSEFFDEAEDVDETPSTSSLDFDDDPVDPIEYDSDEEDISEPKEETDSVLDDRSRLRDEIEDLTSECNHLRRDNKSLTNEAKALRSKFCTLILDKQNISDDAEADLDDKDDIIDAKEDEIRAKDEAIESLEKDVLFCTDESKQYREEKEALLAEVEALKSTLDEQKIAAENLITENTALKQETEVLQRTVDEQKLSAENLLQENIFLKEEAQVLQSTVDEQKSVTENLCDENTALKQETEKVTESLSENEKHALREMSSMTEALIDENSQLKTMLAEERTNSSNDLDEFVWKHKDLEEYSILLEDILNESGREATASRRDSDEVIAASEVELALLRDNLHNLQSQSRKERKSNNLFGSRKLKAIQDLERRLIDLKNENMILNEHLLAEKTKSNNIQCNLDELKEHEVVQRMENKRMQEELAEINQLRESAEDSHFDYQTMVARNNTLMVQNATLQEFIEERRLGFYISNDVRDDESIAFDNASLPADASSSTDITSSVTTEPDADVYTSNDGSDSSLHTAVSSVTSAGTTTEQVKTTQIMTSSNETYAAIEWQENVKSMFENQNRQMTSFQQQIMDEVLDLKRQMAESTVAKSVTTMERVAPPKTVSELPAATEGMSNLTGRVVTLEGEVKSLKRTITKLDDINAKNEALSVQRDAKIECLMGVVDVLTAKNNKLKDDKIEWRKLAKEYKLTLVELNEQNANEITFIEEKYNHYKTETDEVIEALNTDLYNKDRELEMAGHKLRMSNIAAGQVPKLEEHIEAVSKTVDSLSTTLNEKTKTIKRLQKEADEADVAGLRARYQYVSEDLAESEKELKDVRQEKRVIAEKLAKANLNLSQMEMDLVSADETKHGKNHLNMTQHSANAVNVMTEKEAKSKTAVCAGDTVKAHSKELTSKISNRTTSANVSPSEDWSSAKIMIVSKEGMLKTMLEAQEERLKVFMQNNLEKSTNRIDKLRRKFNKMICDAAESKSKLRETDNNTDNDNNDLTETMSDISSASYRTTQGTEEAVASASDATIDQETTGQKFEHDDADTENTDITPLRGFV